MIQFCLGLLFVLTVYSQAPQTHFEQSNGLETVRPDHVLDFYYALAENSSNIKIQEAGLSDLGRPIYTVIIGENAALESADQSNKMVLLINNGIHSGESCGIDASQLLARDLVGEKSNLLKDITVVIIPVYNLGGHQKQSPYNRINQNGPLEMGFRGNAANYDLNRDFIKMDSKNAETFLSIFHTWQPDLFIDNHATNGADYQHALTYMINETAHTTEALREYIQDSFKPALEKRSTEKGVSPTTYVNLKEAGNIKAGIDYFHLAPRYSTGYTDLFNTVSILIETHMLKPYKIRVEASLAFMHSTIETAIDQKDDLVDARSDAIDETKSLETYAISYEKDFSEYDEIEFQGYEFTKKFNRYAGVDLVSYNTERPVTWDLKVYNSYKSNRDVTVPKAYIIPKQWQHVIRRLKANGVKLTPLRENNDFLVEEYRFSKDAAWANSPFEGRHRITNLNTSTELSTKTFSVGDYLVEMNQEQNKYILEVLEPHGVDSFVRWGFFDVIFQQKEYFSPYLFVEKLPELLKMKPELEVEFATYLKENPQFKENPYMRLNFFYERSPWYERHTHLLYPIARVVD
jgi:hypothetical protein